MPSSPACPAVQIGAAPTAAERASQLQSARLLSAIIDSSDDAIRKRLDGTVETCNAGAERLFGYPAAVATGKHISLVIPPERIDEKKWIIAPLKAGRRIDHIETERARADGTAIRMSLTISPIVNETGAVVAASRILRDVSARKYAEAQRQRLLKVPRRQPGLHRDLRSPRRAVRCQSRLPADGGWTRSSRRRTRPSQSSSSLNQARIINECFPQVLRDSQGEIDIRTTLASGTLSIFPSLPVTTTCPFSTTTRRTLLM